MNPRPRPSPAPATGRLQISHSVTPLTCTPAIATRIHGLSRVKTLTCNSSSVQHFLLSLQTRRHSCSEHSPSTAQYQLSTRTHMVDDDNKPNRSTHTNATRLILRSRTSSITRSITPATTRSTAQAVPPHRKQQQQNFSQQHRRSVATSVVVANSSNSPGLLRLLALRDRTIIIGV